MSFRNRCQILGPVKVLDLSVPILGGRDQKGLIKEIRIDNTQAWQLNQWRTLESCYNKSAFFLHYKDELHALLFGSYITLWQLNLATISWVLKQLKVDVQLCFNESFEKNLAADIVDLRNKFRPANRKNFALQPYQQVFGNQLETNLSILDLLFNMGPQAFEYLRMQPVLPYYTIEL